MKIAVWHNLPSGGGKRALYHHVKGLVERGHLIESWCPPTADQSYLPLGNLVSEHIVPLKVTPPARKLSARIRATLDPVAPSLGAMDEHCRACAKQIEEGSFDVLFANSCWMFGTTAIARFVSAPGVLYLQEPFRRLYEAMPNSPWAALPAFGWKHFSLRQAALRLKDARLCAGRRLLVREEINNAKAYRRILVNSVFSRESVARAYGIDSKVCYLGVDAHRFPWSDAPRKKQVISVGILGYAKGADRVIRALACISPEKRPSLLWIGNASDPKYREDVERLALEKGVSFVFREMVSDAELVRSLQESFASIYLARLEPFGYAPLEANCCGLPVIGIAEGGIRETVEDGVNGFLVQTTNPEEIAAALLKLIEQPDLAERMRQQARKIAEEKWAIDGATLRLERELSETGKP